MENDMYPDRWDRAKRARILFGSLENLLGSEGDKKSKQHELNIRNLWNFCFWLNTALSRLETTGCTHPSYHPVFSSIKLVPTGSNWGFSAAAIVAGLNGCKQHWDGVKFTIRGRSEAENSHSFRRSIKPLQLPITWGGGSTTFFYFFFMMFSGQSTTGDISFTLERHRWLRCFSGFIALVVKLMVAR